MHRVTAYIAGMSAKTHGLNIYVVSQIIRDSNVACALCGWVGGIS